MVVGPGSYIRIDPFISRRELHRISRVLEGVGAWDAVGATSEDGWCSWLALLWLFGMCRSSSAQLGSAWLRLDSQRDGQLAILKDFRRFS
jgi:hypothetical protein